MTAFYAGALLERQPGPKYVGQLAFAEIAPRAPVPRAATIAKWKVGLPEGFVSTLVAPREAITSKRGPLRFDPGMEEQLVATIAAARALGARFLLVQTPSELMPGQRDRDLFGAYVGRIAKEAGPTVVWAPAGLWEPEEVQRVAAKVGAIGAFDPLAPETVPPREIAYARLHAAGARSRLSEAMLARALEAVLGAGLKEAFLAIDAPDSFRQAVKVQAIARGAVEAGAGGEGDEDDEDDGEDEDDDEGAVDDDDAEDAEDAEDEDSPEDEEEQ